MRPHRAFSTDEPFCPEAEAAVVARMVAREPDAMDELAQKLARIPHYVEKLNLRSGRRLNGAELEDVAQDAQVAILRSLDAYRPIAPMQAWIYGVCNNHFRAALRDKQRRGQVTTLDDEEAATMAQTPEPVNDWGSVDRVMALVGGVEADVIRLKHLEELTFEEIGGRLEISANTAKTRYYRGLAKLRWRLQEGDAE